MGRHGGGSRSGGRSGGSSSRGGSSSSTKTSNKPFVGSYNRSYINRRGVRVSYYTENKNFGTKSGWNVGTIFAFAFILIHMTLMVGGFLSSAISFGGKVNGNIERIKIVDEINILNDIEEEKIIETFHKVYDKTGMPITLYTDDFDWKNHYVGNSELTPIQVYSEELYYSLGIEEDAMVILFTTEIVDGFEDWEYDFYCGNDTVKCLNDKQFDNLIDLFHKNMSSMTFSESLINAFNNILPNMAKTSIDFSSIITILPVLCIFYGIFIFAILSGVKKSNEAYKYFKQHPQELSMTPITILYNACPYCGASNTEQSEKCVYCGHLLKVSDGKNKFINPNNNRY